MKAVLSFSSYSKALTRMFACGIASVSGVVSKTGDHNGLDQNIFWSPKKLANHWSVVLRSLHVKVLAQRISLCLYKCPRGLSHRECQEHAVWHRIAPAEFMIGSTQFTRQFKNFAVPSTQWPRPKKNNESESYHGNVTSRELENCQWL